MSLGGIDFSRMLVDGGGERVGGLSAGNVMGIEIGSLHVRRSNFVQATPERVWQEFTSFDRLAAWFGRGHQLEA